MTKTMATKRDQVQKEKNHPIASKGANTKEPNLPPGPLFYKNRLRKEMIKQAQKEKSNQIEEEGVDSESDTRIEAEEEQTAVEAQVGDDNNQTPPGNEDTTDDQTDESGGEELHTRQRESG